MYRVTLKRLFALIPPTNSTNSHLSQQPISQRLSSPSFNFSILGDEINVVQIDLYPNQTIRAEVGSLIYMTEGITMDTSLQGGLTQGIKRFISGGSIMLTDFFYKGEEGYGRIMLSSGSFSRIFPINVEDYPEGLICHRDAYICSSPTVQLDTERIKGLTTGFFGGQGFILQKLLGNGTALLRGSGEINKVYLKEGQSIYCATGNIVAYDKNVSYSAEIITGLKNKLFGGEGLFLAKLTGPGEVYIQTMADNAFIYSLTDKVSTSGALLSLSGLRQVYDFSTAEVKGDPVDSPMKTPAELAAEDNPPIVDDDTISSIFDDNIDDSNFYVVGNSDT